MNLKYSINILSRFLKLLGLLMLIPSLCSLIYKENDVYSFLISGIITFVVGFTAERLTKSDSMIEEFNRKDGFFIASFCWISAVLFGALPYLIYGVFNNPIDAFFESTMPLDEGFEGGVVHSAVLEGRDQGDERSLEHDCFPRHRSWFGGEHTLITHRRASGGLAPCPGLVVGFPGPR